MWPHGLQQETITIVNENEPRVNLSVDKSILIEPQQGGGGAAGVIMRKIPIGVKRINVDKPNGGEILDTLNIRKFMQQNINYDNCRLSLELESFDEGLQIYFDNELQMVNQFKLRGVPTTILINKNGSEFARIKGDIKFDDKKFIQWLNQFR